MSLSNKTFASPVGPLLLVASDTALVGIYFEHHKHPPAQVGTIAQQHAVLDRAAQQLNEFFDGSRRTFDLPLAPSGTEFQQAVWAQLREIPFGNTRSYGDIATQLERPGASRAVGAANGRNPLSIVVPCHRVVGSNGALTGYAGGEEAKRWLLRHESSIAPGPLFA
jgi:methylated-DNA-[protein]-cysteine S-methyltransferase